jgi:hypothetical protein
VRRTAIEAGIVFKRERPQSEVTVRDVGDNSNTLIDGEFVAAFEGARKRTTQRYIQSDTAAKRRVVDL